MKVRKVEDSVKEPKEDLRLLSTRYRSRLYRQFKHWKITNSAIAQGMSAEDLEITRQEMKLEMGHEKAVERYRIEKKFEDEAAVLADDN